MRRLFRLLAVVLAALLPLTALAEVDSGFVENQWNYVDQSMDVSQGIPAEAMGVLGRIREAGVLRVAT